MKSLRGRPRSPVTVNQTVDAIRRHRQVVGAARELNCSPALLHKRLRAAQVTLAQVLEAPDVEDTPHG
jgi:hypothetical protein